MRMVFRAHFSRSQCQLFFIEILTYIYGFLCLWAERISWQLVRLSADTQVDFGALARHLDGILRTSCKTQKPQSRNINKSTQIFMRLRRNPPSKSRGLPPALRAETAPECAVLPHDPLEKMRSKWTLSPKSAGTRRDEDPWCFVFSHAPSKLFFLEREHCLNITKNCKNIVHIAKFEYCNTVV